MVYKSIALYTIVGYRMQSSRIVIKVEITVEIRALGSGLWISVLGNFANLYPSSPGSLEPTRTPNPKSE